jgi:hypothetical protein
MAACMQEPVRLPLERYVPADGDSVSYEEVVPYLGVGGIRHPFQVGGALRHDEQGCFHHL